MSARRPFREVKLQWLQQLSCHKDLSDNARSIALYIVTTHMNGHTEKAWPSHQTIADATGKSVKTIQRAIRELEDKEWLDVRRGNGIGHKTEYRPSELSILRASEASPGFVFGHLGASCSRSRVSTSSAMKKVRQTDCGAHDMRWSDNLRSL